MALAVAQVAAWLMLTPIQVIIVEVFLEPVVIILVWRLECHFGWLGQR